jgi:hypothetical protein
LLHSVAEKHIAASEKNVGIELFLDINVTAVDVVSDERGQAPRKHGFIVLGFGCKEGVADVRFLQLYRAFIGQLVCNSVDVLDAVFCLAGGKGVLDVAQNLILLKGSEALVFRGVSYRYNSTC